MAVDSKVLVEEVRKGEDQGMGMGWNDLPADVMGVADA